MMNLIILIITVGMLLGVGNTLYVMAEENLNNTVSKGKKAISDNQTNKTDDSKQKKEGSYKEEDIHNIIPSYCSRYPEVCSKKNNSPSRDTGKINDNKKR